MSAYLKVPVINAMTDVNHPCEVLSDMYALSKIRKNFLRDHFLFVGERGNIGLAWKEASEVMGFSLEQCCGKGYEIDGLVTYYNICDVSVGRFSPFRVGLKTPISVNLKSPMHHVCY